MTRRPRVHTCIELGILIGLLLTRQSLWWQRILLCSTPWQVCHWTPEPLVATNGGLNPLHSVPPFLASFGSFLSGTFGGDPVAHGRKLLNDPLFWGSLGLGGLLYFWQRRSDIISDVKDIIVRGRILTHGSFDPTLGIVIDRSDDLHQAAVARAGFDFPLEAYSLARMIRSEGAAQGEVRAHVALNDLAQLGWKSLHYLLTYSRDPNRKGLYGQQWSPSVPPNYPTANARRYSTREDPYEGDVRLAVKVLHDHANGIDPSNGATKFVDIKSMSGTQSGTRSFQDIDAEWKADGYVAYTLPAYGDNLVFYRRA